MLEKYTKEDNTVRKDRTVVKIWKKCKWFAVLLLFVVALSRFVSYVAYGGLGDLDCPICGGLGLIPCDGEMDHLGHWVGDNTYGNDIIGWSCGYCDGLGDRDSDYERYECKDCGWIGLEGPEEWCIRCGNRINEYHTTYHVKFCDCYLNSLTQAPTPTPKSTPTPTPVPVYYTVSYDGNGASGNMWDSTHQVGVPSSLNSNAFFIDYTITYDQGEKEAAISTNSANTRAYASFSGWAESRWGYAVYSDRETVLNLRTTPGTVWLYAQWGSGSVRLPDAVCSEPGYQLAGWKNEAGTVISVRNTSGAFKNTYYAVSKNETLTAVWEPLEYQIELNDRGAVSTDHTKAVYMISGEYGPEIRIPQKTGYTFQGYFTETRGNGTKYYDAEGLCIKKWAETEIDTLYAYWVQNPVVFPDDEQYKEPEILPELVVEGNVYRTDSKALLYADDYNQATGALNDLQPYLVYDMPGTEGVIPGTERLAFRAKLPSWRLQYKFHRYSGKDMVKIVVTVPYRTQYEDAEEELVISGRETREYRFLIPKAWSYWTVEEFGMYYPSEVTIANEAFKEERITVKVEREAADAVKPPEYEAKRYGERKNHVQWAEYEDGVPVLFLSLDKEEYIISEQVNMLPDIDRYLEAVCRNAAQSDSREAEVRSDFVTWDGKVVLSDEWMLKNGGELEKEMLPADTEEIALTSYEKTYQSGVELNERKLNGMYNTTAELIYTGDEKNIGTIDTIEEVLNINSINIHTPVVCSGNITTGLENGVLALKEAFNEMTIYIDNYGTHRMNLGYGTKDFSKAMSGKGNIAEYEGEYLNQVQFPFKVYAEGDWIEAETWITIGSQKKTVQVPVTQKNGVYQINFRTIAVNCPKELEEAQMLSVTQEKANLDALRYVAADTMEMEVRSFLRDFVITDTNDPTAAQHLNKGQQNLVLKKGYDFAYELLSQGEFYGEKTEWEFTSRFFWVSEDESQRQEVELYRAEYRTEKEKRECYAWEEAALLEQQENYQVILQRFSGKGGIPADILCVPADMKQVYGFSLEEYLSKQTITGKEAFLKKKGYLVINVEMKVKSEEGIWYTFDNWEDTAIYKDAVNAGWKYVSGDIIRYDLSKSVADDYEVGGVE